MDVLFVHNSLPEYRISFMKKLSALCSVKFLITDLNLAHRIYGLEINDLIGIDISFIKNKFSFLVILKYIKKMRPKVVVLPPADSLFQFLCCIVSLWGAYLYKSKTIYWTEKWEFDFRQIPLKKRIKIIIHRQMISLLVHNVDSCIAAGSKSAIFLRGLGINEDKIKIAYDSSTSPQCENFDMFSLYKIPRTNKIILFLGRLVSRKGCRQLIEAISLVIRKNKNICLLIAGDGVERNSCEKLVTKLHLDNFVRFAGKIEPSKRSVYFRQSTLFVLPSFLENGIIEAWGLTVNESLEQGTPVIATDVVGGAYDLLNEFCGLMVRENDVDALANGICKMMVCDDDSLRRRLCHERYLMFSVDRMAKSFFNAMKI